MSAKIIAIGNQKVGVGKTTTAITLGHYFAQHGQRVLIVDLDSQGHSALGLGQKPDNPGSQKPG
jgi:chromosome partitioning protein